MRLPPQLLPPLVPAGTELGMLHPEIGRQTGLEDTQVITSCSHELAAALAGLPFVPGENWAYLQSGTSAAIGTHLPEPIINDMGRESNFTNETGYGGAVRFSKQVPGLWILDECRRFWKDRDREIDADVLMHLATSAEPFESLIDLNDPRFQTPGDIPLKIQAFCKETGQPVPRKPGPTTRCVLESLALQYRRTLREIEYLAGQKFSKIYILGGSANSLLNHFTANAAQIHAVIAPPNITAIGNIVVQALALGHIKSLEEAHQILRDSFKTDTIVPHAAAWDAAYNRLVGLCPA